MPSPSSPSATLPSRPIALITGGHSGIGLYASIQLALKGFQVLIASRSASKVADAIAEAEQTHPELAGQPKKLTHVQLDLTDLDSVRSCAAQVDKTYGRLDVLINNACLHGGGTPYVILPNGIEQMVCTNFIGPALLTSLLLPLLDRTAQQGGDVRILNVTSDQHTAAPSPLSFTAGLPDFNRPYAKNPSGMSGCRKRYGTTKLLLNLLTTHLSSSLIPSLPSPSPHPTPTPCPTPNPSPLTTPLPPIALSLDPGWTTTPSSLSTVPSFFRPLLGLFLSPLEKGGEVLVWGASSPEAREERVKGKMVGRGGEVVKGARGILGVGGGSGGDEQVRREAREVWMAVEGVWEGR